MAITVISVDPNRDAAMAEIQAHNIARAVLRAFKRSWNDPEQRKIIEARMERDRAEKAAKEAKT